MEFTKKRLKIYNYFIRTYLKKAIIETSFYGISPKDASVKIFFSKDIPTAYCKLLKKDKNRKIYKICLCDPESLLEEEKYSKKDIGYYMKILFFHEYGHINFTNMENEFFEKIKNSGVPFEFFNLAEDARIEHKIRLYLSARTKKNFYFHFNRFLETPKIELNMHPEALLFCYINEEGKKRYDHILDNDVYNFYQKFINAKNSEEVLEICKEWIYFFKKKYNQNSDLREKLKDLVDRIREQNQNSSTSILSSSLLDMRFEDMESDERMGILEEGQEEREISLDELLEMIQNNLTQEEINDTENNQEHIKNLMMSDFSLSDITNISSIENDNVFFEDRKNGKDNYKINNDLLEEIKRYIENMKTFSKKEKIIKKKQRKSSFRTNKKKLVNVKVNPSDKLYVKKIRKIEEGDEKTGKIEMNLILDTSGSMSGEPEIFQKTFLLGLNEYAKNNKDAKINVILSKKKLFGSDKVSSDHTQFAYKVIPLPQSNERDIIGYDVHSGDGIIATLSQIPQDFRVSNVKNNIIISDGYIDNIEEFDTILQDNKNFSKVMNEYNNVYLYYNKSSSVNSQIKNHFDFVIDYNDYQNFDEFMNSLVSILRKKNKIIWNKKVNNVEQNIKRKL